MSPWPRKLCAALERYGQRHAGGPEAIEVRNSSVIRSAAPFNLHVERAADELP